LGAEAPSPPLRRQAMPRRAVPSLALAGPGLFFNNDIVGYQPTIPLALFCPAWPCRALPRQALPRTIRL